MTRNTNTQAKNTPAKHENTPAKHENTPAKHETQEIPNLDGYYLLPPNTRRNKIRVPHNILNSGWWGIDRKKRPSIKEPILLIGLFQKKSPISPVCLLGKSKDGRSYDRLQYSLDYLMALGLLDYEWTRGKKSDIVYRLRSDPGWWKMPATTYRLHPMAARLSEILHPRTYSTCWEIGIEKLLGKIGMSDNDPGRALSKIKAAVAEINTVFPLAIDEKGGRGWQRKLVFSSDRQSDRQAKEAAKQAYRETREPIELTPAATQIAIERAPTTAPIPPKQDKTVPTPPEPVPELPAPDPESTTAPASFYRAATLARELASRRIEESRQIEEDKDQPMRQPTRFSAAGISSTPAAKPRGIPDNHRTEITIDEFKAHLASLPGTDTEPQKGIFPLHPKSYDEIEKRLPDHWQTVYDTETQKMLPDLLRILAGSRGIERVHAAVVHVVRTENMAKENGTPFPLAEKLRKAVEFGNGVERLNAEKIAETDRKRRENMQAREGWEAKQQREEIERQREIAKQQRPTFLKMLGNTPPDKYSELWNEATERAGDGAREFGVKMAFVGLLVEKKNEAIAKKHGNNGAHLRYSDALKMDRVVLDAVMRPN